MTNETWYDGTTVPSGNAVGNAGVAALDGYLYVAGGVKKHTGQEPSNKTFRYDPSTEEWTELASMNRSRWGLTLTAFDGRLYAMGGANHTSTSWWIQPDVFDDVEVYEPSNDTWWNLSDMPKAVFGHASVVLHEEILVIGDTERDIQCARTIGVKVLAVATGPNPISELESFKPDVVVTHEAPLRVNVNRHDRYKNPTPRGLENVLKYCEHTPARWYFGHHHMFEKWEIEGTTFYCCGLHGQYYTSDGRPHDPSHTRSHKNKEKSSCYT